MKQLFPPAKIFGQRLNSRKSSESSPDTAVIRTLDMEIGVLPVFVTSTNLERKRACRDVAEINERWCRARLSPSHDLISYCLGRSDTGP